MSTFIRDFGAERTAVILDDFLQVSYNHQLADAKSKKKSI